MNGEKLRNMLEERNMTQKELAAAIGVTKSAVCAFIAETTTPSLPTAALIAKVLGVTIDELVSE